MSEAADRARKLWGEIAERLDSDSHLAQRVAADLQRALNASRRGSGRPPNRRAEPVLDPFDVYREQAGALRPALEALDAEQLKDIVSRHAMDPSRLALKWKRKDRLVDLICQVVEQRSSKGDVFRRS